MASQFDNLNTILNDNNTLKAVYIDNTTTTIGTGDFNAYPQTITTPNTTQNVIQTTLPYTTSSSIWTTTGRTWDDLMNTPSVTDEIQKNIDYLMKFLIMKGIIKDEQEFKDFVDAMEVAEKLTESCKEK